MPTNQHSDQTPPTKNRSKFAVVVRNGTEGALAAVAVFTLLTLLGNWLHALAFPYHYEMVYVNEGCEHGNAGTVSRYSLWNIGREPFGDLNEKWKLRVCGPGILAITDTARGIQVMAVGETEQKCALIALPILQPRTAVQVEVAGEICEGSEFGTSFDGYDGPYPTWNLVELFFRRFTIPAIGVAFLGLMLVTLYDISRGLLNRWVIVSAAVGSVLAGLILAFLAASYVAITFAVL